MMRILSITLMAAGLAACSEPKPERPAPPAVEAAILTAVGDSASTIEGIAESGGMLYVCDWKDGTIYQIDPANPTPVAVGKLPVPPGTIVLGMTTDADGNLYLAAPETGTIYRVAAGRLGAADFDPTKDATAFATGAAGANAIAFNPATGELWITGGPTGNLYHVGPTGGSVITAASEYAVASTDTTVPVRVYVTNGIAIDGEGAVYTANTGTGEISRVTFGAGDQPSAITSLVRDSRLVGADGLQFDSEGNLWVTANYRNTLARVGPDGTVTIVASSAPTDGANILRFPAEFTRIGNTIYLANLNFPIGTNTGQPVAGASVATLTLP